MNQPRFPFFPRSILLLILLGTVPGCDPKPTDSALFRFETGDYAFECDGQQKKVKIGPGLMRMSRYPEDIEVSDGTLKVGGRDYGAVARKDAISVVGGKVAVNGRIREPVDPR